MNSVAEIINQTLQAAKLALPQLAVWARLDESLLRDASEGRASLSAAQLDRIACVFGLRLDDLLEGKAGTAPMTLLLRSSADDSSRDIRGVLTSEVDRILGEFQRVVRDLDDLSPVLDLPVWQDKLRGFQPLLPPRSHQSTEAQIAEARAERLREFLNLGADPIPSMRQFLASLGVVVVWADDEELDHANVEGACTLTPRPAVLVKASAPWRARMTMAHELGHLLFDLSDSHPVLVSPHHQSSNLPWLDQIEQNANAFAAALLAPASGVRRRVGGGAPDSEEAIRLVGGHYGVGRTTAINRLRDIFCLPDSQYNEMRFWRQNRQHYPNASEDRPPNDPSLRGEPLRSFVCKALKANKLSPYRARKMLGLTPADPLPFDSLPAEQTAGKLSSEQQVLRQAQVHLSHNYPQRSLFPDTPHRSATGWEISISEGGLGDRERIDAGYLRFSLGGEVSEDCVKAEPSTREP